MDSVSGHPAQHRADDAADLAAPGAAGLVAGVAGEVAAVLGVAAGTLDPGTDLVAQGLDSIRMMSLAGRWRRRGLDVDFARLAAEPTITAWSALLAAAKPTPTPTHPPDPGADTEPFPLAPMQHAMWVGRDPDVPLGGVAGHLYVEFDSEPGDAAIDPARLRAAVAAVTARHPMLRVRFLPDGTQRIQPAGRCRVEVQDLRGLDAAEAQQRLAETRRTKSHQQLDDAVLEVTVSQLPDGSGRLHVDLDMQAADAMSYRILMSDLAACYRGAQLPPLNYTYRRYRSHAADRRPDDAHRQWWAQRLPELPEPPPLPARLGAPDHPHRTVRHWHWLDPATRDALFGHAHLRGVTPAMVLAASFAHTVARWSDQQRFLLNVPLFDREPLHPDVEGLVGDFTSSLLLDVDLRGTQTGTARARAVQDAMRAAAAHSGYPGLSVLRDLSRHRGRQVLAPVVFTSALGLGELFDAGVTDTFGAPVWIISQGPQVVLDAQVTEFDGGVLVNWDVREQMFPPGLIEAMFAHHIDELTRLAGGAGWDEPAPPALPAEPAAVRALVNSGAAEPGGDALPDGFFRRAVQTPEATAILHGGGATSYGALRDQALAVAAALHDQGVRPGDTVALLGPKCAEQIPALLGILAAGATYLPVSADQPPQRTQRILALGKAAAVLVTGERPPAVDIPALPVREALRHPPAAEPITVGELAYVVFTSGSTGEPKGVEVSHDAAMNTVETLSARFGFGPQDRSLALLTLDADMSVLDIFAMLRAGGAVVVVEEADRRSPEVWARLIAEHRVSVLNLMPGSLEMLLAAAGELSSVRAVLTGGDWVRPELARRFRARVPAVRFAGLGGATETAIHATLFEVDDELPAEWPAVPYGVPLPNMACRVVGADGADCPDWVAGELWVSGRGLARGYRGRPDLTAERFVEYRDRTWYRTGDLARYWPDGTLEFVGRADHRVKISGYRVELGEVEAALQQLPGVTGAVAVTLPEHGGREMLAAAVCAGHPPPPDLSVATLRAGLAAALPEHMIPRLTLVPAIPYTASGKIDRRTVAAQLAAGGAAVHRYRAPATALQRALAAIFADVLGVTAVGADDDFFALGGDSVLATAVVARVRSWLDAPRAVVADMFAARTVARLAERLVGAETDPDRLDAVAQVYLDVARLGSAAVVDALAAEIDVSAQKCGWDPR